MKLYRYIKSQEQTQCLISRGYENEGNNLIKEGFISPSFMYADFISGRKDRLANSFAPEQEMTKYFFLSLKDAIAWASYCYLRDIKKYGLIFVYAILEIDVPLEIGRKYLGMGYYDEINRLEARLPYEVLFEVLNGQDNKTFIEALNLYNSTYHRILFPWHKDLRKFLKENRDYKCNDNLQYLGVNKLYPYLCFPINKSYAILNPVPEKQTYAWPYLMSSELEHLASNHEMDEVSLIAEENAEAKLILQKKGYNFEVREGR